MKKKNQKRFAVLLVATICVLIVYVSQFSNLEVVDGEGQISNCDSLDGWGFTHCTAAVDSSVKTEGSASIRIMNNAELETSGYARFTYTMDLSTTTQITFQLRSSSPIIRPSISVLAPDWSNIGYYDFTVTSDSSFHTITVVLSAPSRVTGSPDLSSVTVVSFNLETISDMPWQVWIDDIQASKAAVPTPTPTPTVTPTPTPSTSPSTSPTPTPTTDPDATVSPDVSPTPDGEASPSPSSQPLDLIGDVPLPYWILFGGAAALVVVFAVSRRKKK